MKHPLKTLRQKYYQKKYPKWGSPIVDLYAYNQLLVVATKLDLFVTEDGVYFEKVKVDASS
jgi:hypothetical protein